MITLQKRKFLSESRSPLTQAASLFVEIVIHRSSKQSETRC